MWRVDDCFIHGCVDLLLLDVSIGCVSHFFQDVSFFSFVSTIVFDLSVLDF